MSPAGRKTEASVTPPRTTKVAPVGALHQASSADHNFPLQAAFEIQRTLGKLEHAVEALAVTLAKQEAKMDDISKDVISAKAATKTALWILGGLGTLLSVLLSLVAHHFKLL